MTAINTMLGWSQDDPVNLLIASGLTVGGYQIEQVTVTMNKLGAISSQIISNIQGLIGEFQDAQDALIALNGNADGKVLVKADVLEWEQSKGVSYSPEREIMRIRGLLYQYMASCPLYEAGGAGSISTLYRS